MKTLMVELAAITLIATSCLQNETFQNETSTEEIKFSNLNDRIPSKAANDSLSNYGVYAVHNDSPAPTDWFMNNQLVNGTDNSYTPLKFWPKTGTVSFYSYAPYNSGSIDFTEVKWNASTPAFGISYTVPANADEDFTIADPQLNLSSGEVLLEFSHMLSKVSFNAHLSDDLVNDGFVLTLDSVILKVTSNYGETALDAPSGWNNIGLSGSAIYRRDTAYMIMPQPVQNAEIILNVNITHHGTEYFSGNLNEHILTTQPGLSNFNKGTNYSFSFTVGDTATDEGNTPLFNIISFSSDIAPWVSASIPVPQP